MNIIICGMPASGKTTIGKKAAEKIAWDFIDTDQLIESVYASQTGRACSCNQIYMKEGEVFFATLKSNRSQV